MKVLRSVGRSKSLLMLILTLVALPASAQQKKPNVLVIWGDDTSVTATSVHIISA